MTVNKYFLNSGGKTRELGEAVDSDLPVSDSALIAQYGALPLTDPTGGRPISTGMVWLERTGSAGWTPIIYTSRNGRRPVASDAPSMIPWWIFPAVAAVTAYFVFR